MNRANSCRLCRTDKHLKFKTYDEKEWWVNCEGCGRVSQPKASMAEAGEQWNNENPRGVIE